MSKQTEIVYWDRFASGGRQYYLAGTENGLVHVNVNPVAGTAEESLAAFAKEVKQYVRQAELVHAPERLQEAVLQLQEYLAGERQEFALEMDLRGTDFQRAVWQALLQIPYGQTQSYLDIARAIGKEKAVRAVGGAVGRNPLLVIVPCHRVIGKSGTLTGFSSGLDLKVQLLELEGFGIANRRADQLAAWEVLPR